MAIGRHRPAAVSAAITVLLFLGITALLGGVAMLAGYTPPREWLNGVPLITGWVVPGLVLGAGFGIGSLVTAFGVMRWQRWAWFATVLIGLGQIAWIGLELIYLPEPSVLQAIYGPVGVTLAVLPFTPSMRRVLRRQP